jgi:hypothetical protein
VVEEPVVVAGAEEEPVVVVVLIAQILVCVLFREVLAARLEQAVQMAKEV